MDCGPTNPAVFVAIRAWRGDYGVLLLRIAVALLRPHLPKSGH
jgi:hypothetical protein